jgi:hypothetical protein
MWCPVAFARGTMVEVDMAAAMERSDRLQQVI